MSRIFVFTYCKLSLRTNNNPRQNAFLEAEQYIVCTKWAFINPQIAESKLIKMSRMCLHTIMAELSKQLDVYLPN